jgi:hypothetical protein
MTKLKYRSELIKEAENKGMEVHDLASQLVREDPELVIVNDIKE